jgi:6-phosphofructokinase 1
MRRIGILTSGGDAPGMNAAIRAVVRSAAARKWEVWGILQGYEGLIEGRMRPLGTRDVSGIIQQAGTILGSARCPAFREVEGRRKAIRELNLQKLDGLVVIGGNGTQTGAHGLSEMGFPVVGVASTIDNDLCGSDVTIGADTALNVALEAIDRLKVTASAHERAIFLEVMGRDCGYLALMSGIAGGAEAIVCPEFPREPQEVAAVVRHAYDAGKTHALVVVAEGAPYNAAKLADYFRENRAELGFEVRITILGHVQRGGTPSAFDRILGTRLGAAAVECLERGEFGVLVGRVRGATTVTPLTEVAGCQKPLDAELIALADVLAR